MPYNSLVSRTDAAALIPEDVANEVLGRLPEQSAAMTLFRRVPVARAQQRMPVLSALPTAYWVTGDTGLKQTTEMAWANKFLNIEELAAIVPIPDSVVEDADFDIWGEIRPALEEAIGRALDAAIFFGAGAPGTFPQNVVAAATAAGNTVARGSAAAVGGVQNDLDLVMATVEGDGYDVNGWAAARSLKGRLRQARNTQGDRLQGVNDTLTEYLGERIVYPMRGLWPTGVGAAEAVGGDWTQFVLGVRRDISYTVADQAVIQDNTGAIVYNLFQQDMKALRVTFRAGWQVANVINNDQPVEANRYPVGVLTAP